MKQLTTLPKINLQCIRNPNLGGEGIGQNSDGRISHFQIYGQSFINENYQNSRTSHDIDTSHNTEIGPVTKIDKRNRQHQTKLTMTSCQQIVTFLSLFNRIPDSGGADYKTYIFINNDLLSCKNWNKNKKISNAAFILLLWVKVLFLPKMLIFCKNMLISVKLRESY